MKKIYLIVFLLGSLNTFSQGSIEYTFPKKVTDKLTSYINERTLKKHYIIMDKTSPSTYFIMILPQQKKDSLLTRTNRYVKINNNKIPIMFKMDTDFLSKGIGINGGIIRTAEIYHGFTIFFNYSGEILKE